MSSPSSAVDSASPPVRHRLWLLRLVPDVRHGRWWCALGLFGVLVGMYWITGSLAPEQAAWPAALFFCVILAYIVPVFDFITRKTEEAFDALAPELSVSSDARARMRSSISEKSHTWLVINTSISVSLWLLQSWLLTGSVATMGQAITQSITSLSLVLGPLLVWVFMTCAIHALVDNARLFRALTRHVHIDPLDTNALTPFGSMAVSSTLAVIGSQAAFPILWLGPETDPWTTIPGLIGTTVPLLYLFFAPILPIHVALRTEKQRELGRVQEEINARRRAGSGEGASASEAMAPLLIYRREVAGSPEWPIDLGLLARLGLYLIIVPLTWIGAALIELIVDFFVQG
jgi:hypothetical protein